MSNEDIKMSSVFGASLYNDPAQRLSSAIVLYGPEKDAAIHAIANHDQMALRIKELESALNRISELTNNYNIINAKQIADYALGNGKKQ